MRCAACNRQLTDTESHWNEATQEHGKLCGICKPISNQAVDDIQAEEWKPVEPVYPHDLRWTEATNNWPDSDD